MYVAIAVCHIANKDDDDDDDDVYIGLYKLFVQQIFCTLAWSVDGVECGC